MKRWVLKQSNILMIEGDTVLGICRSGHLASQLQPLRPWKSKTGKCKLFSSCIFSWFSLSLRTINECLDNNMFFQKHYFPKKEYISFYSHNNSNCYYLDWLNHSLLVITLKMLRHSQFLTRESILKHSRERLWTILAEHGHHHVQDDLCLVNERQL